MTRYFPLGTDLPPAVCARAETCLIYAGFKPADIAEISKRGKMRGTSKKRPEQILCRMVTYTPALRFFACFDDTDDAHASAYNLDGADWPFCSLRYQAPSRAAASRRVSARARREVDAFERSGSREGRITPLRCERPRFEAVRSPRERSSRGEGTGFSVRYATRCHRAKARVSTCVWARAMRAPS